MIGEFNTAQVSLRKKIKISQERETTTFHYIIESDTGALGFPYQILTGYIYSKIKNTYFIWFFNLFPGTGIANNLLKFII